MSEQKPWSWRRDVARGALIVVFVLLTVGVLSLPVGLVDGLTFRVSQDRLIQVRSAFPTLRLACEKEAGRSKWINYDNPGTAIPLVFRFRRYVVCYMSPEDPCMTRPAIRIMPTGPLVNGWELRFHVWPFAVLTIAYPAFILFRFLRPIRPRSIARRILPVGLVSLFTLVAVVSSLACIGVSAVWVRSRWTHDHELSTRIFQNDGNTIYRTYLYASRRGAVMLGRVESEYLSSSNRNSADHYGWIERLYAQHVWNLPTQTYGKWYQQLGFDFASGQSATNPPHSHWWIGLPCWLLVLISAVLPVAWIRWFRRRLIARRRLSVGWCHKCGYNLRGNVSGICPECGEKIEPCVP